jgi:hypothetical protein
MTNLDPKSKPNDGIDPEFIEPLLQALSALANIATLASAWKMFRDQRQAASAQRENDFLRNEFRQLTRLIDRLFEELEEVLRVFSRAYERDTGKDLLDQPVRFGNKTILTPNEWSGISASLNEISNAYVMIRAHSYNLQTHLQRIGLVGEDKLGDQLENLNAGINAVLFESRNFQEAIHKLRSLKHEVDRYLDEVRKMTN